ncbi:hypothetical protein [Paenibacillus sp. L3-i20]|uniref:hypothetical protein n=1 Tax=Paenibacillus sp. L3-i20 TaxID=2905833 RepID=UPI001EDD4B78|nr:hypothetical protein [Paenibacillus sp. L3-i20]GKU79341.1 hypothetical protein L3i20_v237380 [Paenibacillus sp. L3-i20]
MNINIDRLWKLMEEVADGKYRVLARMLGVQHSHLHKVLNAGSKAGPVMLGKLHTYCEENGLSFEEFIVKKAE